MTKQMKASEVLLKLLKYWEACSVDSEGQTRGLIAIWNHRKCKLTPYKTREGILLEGRIQGFKETIRLLNVYAPYKYSRVFWENVEASSFLSLPNLIMGGDLNFTMFSHENWGMMSLVDMLASFFQAIFRRNNLIDIIPPKLSPT